MPGSTFAEHIVDVFEIFVVPTLVGRQGNPLGIFLDGGVDDFFGAAVVSKVDDLGSGALHDASHDIDGGIVAVKKGGGRHHADVVLRLIGCGRLVRFHEEAQNTEMGQPISLQEDMISRNSLKIIAVAPQLLFPSIA